MTVFLLLAAILIPVFALISLVSRLQSEIIPKDYKQKIKKSCFIILSIGVMGVALAIYNITLWSEEALKIHEIFNRFLDNNRTSIEQKKKKSLKNDRDPYRDLEKLATLKEKGLITESEYESKRQIILERINGNVK